MEESLRWMPTGILGVPHAVIRDDEYRGYRIPKDSSIVLNICVITTYTFGAGRRICQGLHVADDFLFLSIARLMWAFNFDRAIDPQTGKEIVV
ncbi:cytochrome P450 [Pseudoneurospora amorphoporcata]|uniref:Cytochrome P450 n=1 Tax=Pseudoneurospora amorphoporcata TaxID=241081 RepID=A0AAN6NP60_9PEZI|nr:cytochrome P450 [Pseudoneurospora amorphoporcata]